VDAECTPRLSERFAAARRARFVGRRTELELFRTALVSKHPPFSVLHVFGPGGIGKTTLLMQYARLADDAGATVVRLDGRDLEPTPPGFLVAVQQGSAYRQAPNHIGASASSGAACC
jgi:hypothetical protein